jgi:peptide/nickel transport system ATP-binding protein
LRAVDGVSFSIARGQVLALVGESGCGKTLICRSVLRLVEPPGEFTKGQIVVHPRDGRAIDVVALADDDRQLYELRGGIVSMIFQEPMSAWSPVHTIGNQFTEAICLHRPITAEHARRMALDSFARVGIRDPARVFDSYPHQLSGGMCQRCMIAMAMASEPDLLIADEPTTALDVTLQAQVLSLLADLQRTVGCGVLLVTHDLGVVAQVADRVAVMYLGRIVEMGPVDAVFAQPVHPYTRGLLAAARSLQSDGALSFIPGTVPPLSSVPAGCSFHPRCAHALAGVCDTGIPTLREVSPGRTVACVRAGELPRDDGLSGGADPQS